MLSYLREKLDEPLFKQVEAALEGEKLPQLAAELEKRLSAAEKAAAQAKKDFALQLALERAGAVDSEYLRDQLREEAQFDQNGALLDGDSLLAKAKERHPALFPAPKVEGVRPAESFSAPEPDLSGMSLAQRTQLYLQDPAAYRRMRGE